MTGNRNVLLTGGSGFLGKYVFEKLSENNFEIFSLGRKNIGQNHITADFLKSDFELPNVTFNKVIHLAGKAHVYPRTEEERKEFEKINYLATLQLIQQLEKNKTFPEVFIFASTVAVYGRDFGSMLKETDQTAPTTPYGMSKLNAEKALIDWCNQHQVKYAILRLPLIAGSNPPGNLGNIKNAINKGFYFSIKNNTARKSIVLASDIADLVVDYQWKKSGVYNLTDNVHPTFNEVEHALEKALNKKIKLNLPLGFVKLLARCGDILKALKLPAPLNSLVIEKMTNSLTFDDSKAKTELGWTPNPVIPFLEKHI